MNEYLDKAEEKSSLFIDSESSPLHFTKIGTIPKTQLQRIVHETKIPSRLTANPAATAATNTMSQTDQQHNAASNANIARIDLGPVLQRQSDLADLFVTQPKQASLTIREIPVFSGDPLEYRPFMRSFIHNIEEKTDNNQEGLYYLELFTAGEPKELVRSCLYMNTSRGYAEAKCLLKHHFGDEFKLASAYMEKALKWGNIRSDDGKALYSYAVYLRGCCNAAQDLVDLKELNLPFNLKIIVSRLPYKLGEKWRATACEILEHTQRRPDFADLIAFIDKQAKILLDPVFGEIQDPKTNSNIRKTVTEPPMHKSSCRKSFVTTVSSIEASKQNSQPKKNQGHANVAFNKPCLFCDYDHAMDSCVKMVDIPHKDKMYFLRTNGLCFACLKQGYLTKACKKRLTCQICSKKHPTVLHIKNATLDGGSPNSQIDVHKKDDDSKKANSSRPVIMAVVSTEHTGAGSAECKLAIIPVKLKATKGSRVFHTYAFLVPGSSSTFCMERLMRRLNMAGKQIKIMLKTMGQEKPIKTFRLSGLEVSGLDSNYCPELSHKVQFRSARRIYQGKRT